MKFNSGSGRGTASAPYIWISYGLRQQQAEENRERGGAHE
jgi:hypothetical protein